MDNLNYLKLNGKTPKHKLDKIFTKDEVADELDIGVYVEKPYVVVDIDIPEEDSDIHERLLELIMEEGIKSRIYKTSRGYHFWFKSKDELKSRSGNVNALTISTDIKAWGFHEDGTTKKAFVKLRDNGVDRELINDIPLDELDEIPRWLTHIRPAIRSTYDFVNMTTGDRNDKLLSYILFLQNLKYSKVEIRYILTLINEYVLQNPIPYKELQTIYRDEMFKDNDELRIQDWFTDKGAFKHNVFGDYIINSMSILTFREQTFAYRDGYYQPMNTGIEKRMIDEIPYLKSKDRREVLSYISIRTEVDPNRLDIDEYVINIKNGRLDLRYGRLSKHSEDYYDFARVNATYDPQAYCEDTHKMLMRVFCQDEELFTLFKQALGYSLTKNAKHQVAFLLTGEGSNGKSTFLNMVREFVGRDNVSTLSLTDIEDRFRPSGLHNKLINIGDDISNMPIRDTGKFKNLVSGEGVTVERKNKDHFDLYNYATLWFGANKMPSFADKSHGMERRMLIIPFDAEFSPQDDDYDADIEEKITSEQARSYLLNLAIEGVQLLRELGTFVIVDRVEKQKESYKVESSTILSWLEEDGYTREDILGQPTKVIYAQYERHCSESGIKKPFSRTLVTREINEHFNLRSGQTREDGKRISTFVDNT